MDKLDLIYEAVRSVDKKVDAVDMKLEGVRANCGARIEVCGSRLESKLNTRMFQWFVGIVATVFIVLGGISVESRINQATIKTKLENHINAMDKDRARQVPFTIREDVDPKNDSSISGEEEKEETGGLI